MRRFLTLAIAAIFGLSLAYFTDAKEPDEVFEFSVNDQTMNAAISAAQDSLPLFLENVATPDGIALPAASLKVAMPTVSGGDEIIWVSNIRMSGDSFSGSLDNAPVDLGDLQLGDHVSFTYDQIYDWGLPSETGRLYGHYTTRVIAQIPGNESILDYLEPEPIPATWQ